MQRYGVIEFNTFSNKEQQVQEVQYDLLDPLVTMFTEVEALQ